MDIRNTEASYCSSFIKVKFFIFMNKERKRISRCICLQVIYAYEVSGERSLNIFKNSNNLDNPIIMNHFSEDLTTLFGNLSKSQLLYSQKLYDVSIDNKDFVDKLIKDRLKNWDISRLAIIDKIILRMSVAEMFFIKDVPPKVSIAEGVEIAKVFSTDDSSSFVNGILDAIYNDVYMNDKKINKV